MEAGKILDRLFFGVGPQLVVIDAGDYRTKAAQTARDEAEADGYLPVLRCKLTEYEVMVETWKTQFRERGIHFDGESQVTLLWQDGDTACKGIVDHIEYDYSFHGVDEAIIYDLKTCSDAATDAITGSFVKYGYDIQCAAYVDGLQSVKPDLAGRVQMRFLFCETKRPYAVNVVEPAGSMRSLGNQKWRHAVKTWGACLRGDCFPGYQGVSRIEARPWMIDQFLTQEGADDGDGNN